MMDDRLRNSMDLLSEHGVFATHIDENEYEKLFFLFEKIGGKNLGTMIWDKGAPVTGAHGLATQHEYIIWRSLNSVQLRETKENIKEMRNYVQGLIEQYGSPTAESISLYRNWLKKNKKLSKAEKIYDLFDEEGRIYCSGNMAATDKRQHEKFYTPLKHPKTGKPCPVPANGWRYTPETIKNLLENDLILFGNDEYIVPRRKTLLEDNLSSQLPSINRSGFRGKLELDALGLDFSFAHSSHFYFSLCSSVIFENNKIILDFFGGSATSFHSTQKLNKDYRVNTKCILIEQGDYVYTVIIPRIKKVAYAFDWKDGRPRNGTMNGLGVFLKYQRLEQYEEALENIAFSAGEKTIQKALEFKEYIPKYFLEFETRDSLTRLNTEEMADPWNYELQVWDGLNYDTRTAVDLVETFNYLIGLHMHKYFTKEVNGLQYRFVYGRDNAHKKILIVWRTVKDWDIKDFAADGQFLRKELASWTYDALYVNGQAHIDGYQPIEEIFKNKMIQNT